MRWPIVISVAAAALALGVAVVLLLAPSDEQAVNNGGPGEDGAAAPAVRIVAAYPGASPQRVERGVVLALEAAVGGVQGVARMEAEASEGLAVLTLWAKGGVDLHALADRVREALARPSSLPEGADRPYIELVYPSAAPLTWTLSGDVDLEDLGGLGETLSHLAQRQPGARTSGVDCGVERQVEVELDDQRLATYGATMASVADAIGRRGATSGGFIEAGGREVLVRAVRASAIDDLEHVVVHLAGGGVPVRLRDVAVIRDRTATVGCAAWADGRRVVSGDLVLEGGLDARKRLLSDWHATLPARVRVQIVEDAVRWLAWTPAGDRDEAAMETTAEALRRLDPRLLRVWPSRDGQVAAELWLAPGADPAPLPGIVLARADEGGLDAIVVGDGLEALATAADAIARAAAGLPGVRGVRPRPPGRRQLEVVPDRERLARLGLTVHAVTEALRSELRMGGDPPVVLRRKPAPDPARTLIMTPKEGSVPLSEVATITHTEAQRPIERVDGRRVTRVRLYGPESQRAAWREALSEVALPAGVGLRWATVSPGAAVAP